ncbi:hypothetical protein CKA32_003743 [Geitlerinema sp. FC II]|nr:hypothetical protein CKA32_003743 [Geitlerinema sp. FC II]
MDNLSRSMVVTFVCIIVKCFSLKTLLQNQSIDREYFDLMYVSDR